MINFTPGTIAALVIAVSFAAGLNVYATVLTLGILARAHWLSATRIGDSHAMVGDRDQRHSLCGGIHRG